MADDLRPTAWRTTAPARWGEAVAALEAAIDAVVYLTRTGAHRQPDFSRFLLRSGGFQPPGLGAGCAVQLSGCVTMGGQPR